MKILFELPDKEKTIAARLLGDAKILYSAPYDLNLLGKIVDGWIIITKNRYIRIENGELIEDTNIMEGKDYKLVNAVGSGMIEVEMKGETRIILRFSMEHLPRYTYIAKILDTLSKDEEVKIVSDDIENKCPKCGRMYSRGSRVCPKCMNRKVILKRFFSVVKLYKIHIFISIALFWVITGLNLINPMIYRKLIDGYINKNNADAFKIFLLVLSIGICDVSRTLIDIIKNRLMIKAGTCISRDLRRIVFSKIQALSIGYLDTRKTGDLMNRVTGDTNSIQQFICNQASMGVNQVLTLVVVTVLLLVMNWKLAVMIMIPVPFIVYILKWRKKTFSAMYHTQWKIADRCNSILHDILSGIKVVKAFEMEEREVGRFSKESKKLADITARNEKVYNTIFPLLNFCMGIGNFLILYFGGKLILNKQMELGQLIQFTQYAGMIYGPLGWLTFFPRALTEATTAAERIFEIIDEEPAIKDRIAADKIGIKGNVTFDNLTFGYHSYEPVLKNITLDVKQGEMIGLVGHSGAGKSTLINMIMRLYDVDEGRILIDGKDIRDISLNILRSQIGVVLQETFLFSGTIFQNIIYAKPNATLEEVIRAAKIANAHEFIMKFQDGYDTRVGEKGQRLSGGERQRIAIARAILHDPKILILDEATASVDTETEYQIQEALSRLIKNRTTFAIAHRLSTLRNATRLLVLEHGRQIELGSHEELMRAKGKYYSLVMAQREMSRTKGA